MEALARALHELSEDNHSTYDGVKYVVRLEGWKQNQPMSSGGSFYFLSGEVMWGEAALGKINIMPGGAVTFNPYFTAPHGPTDKFAEKFPVSHISSWSRNGE